MTGSNYKRNEVGFKRLTDDVRFTMRFEISILLLVLSACGTEVSKYKIASSFNL